MERIGAWCLLYFLWLRGIIGFSIQRNQLHGVTSVFCGDKREDLTTANSDHQVANVTNVELRKTIGIDYGLSRTGLAMSGGYAAALPLQIVDTGPNMYDEIIHTMRLYGLEQIVLGWPIHKNASIAEQAIVTREFGLTLKDRVSRQLGDIPVYLCDERYTSKAARATLRNNNEGLERVDSIAACMILDSFFDGEKVLELVLPQHAQRDCLEEFAKRKHEQDAKKRADMEYRDLQRQRRKEAIARDQQLRALDGPSGKKKKKKRKR